MAEQRVKASSAQDRFQFEARDSPLTGVVGMRLRPPNAWYLALHRFVIGLQR